MRKNKQERTNQELSVENIDAGIGFDKDLNKKDAKRIDDVYDELAAKYDKDISNQENKPKPNS